MEQKDIHFIDITGHAERSTLDIIPKSVTYPQEMMQAATVGSLSAKLDSAKMKRNLEMFSSFNNRYYQSNTGNLSAEWLFGQAKAYLPANSFATVSIFQHSYRQSSIVARIQGQSDMIIVVGAHQDSINGEIGINRTTARAPGAGLFPIPIHYKLAETQTDDNGSGSMTILEVFRTLLSNKTIANGGAEHTIEFHWYAGEEVGLLGSSNIFWNYYDENRDVVAMLNQDMTGYTAGYTSHNMTPKFGLITDNTDVSLNEFVKRIIGAYTNTEVAETSCGYACSDHVSANRVGYPSAFVFEGEMHTVNDNPYVHTADDTIEKIDFAHMIEHARLVVGFVVELAFASL